MSRRFDQESSPRPRNGGFGILGVAAIVGLIAAAVVFTGRNRRTGHSWSVDDLINAADKAAETLELALNGEKARAS